MPPLTLVTGTKNYVSWSLRTWLLLRQAGILFEEVRIPLYRPGSTEALAAWSPSGKVPVLHDGDLRVWDSLAICEYLQERFPDKRCGRPLRRRGRFSTICRGGARPRPPRRAKGSRPGGNAVYLAIKKHPAISPLTRPSK